MVFRPWRGTFDGAGCERMLQKVDEHGMLLLRDRKRTGHARMQHWHGVLGWIRIVGGMGNGNWQIPLEILHGVHVNGVR